MMFKSYALTTSPSTVVRAGSSSNQDQTTLPPHRQESKRFEMEVRPLINGGSI